MKGMWNTAEGCLAQRKRSTMVATLLTGGGHAEPEHRDFDGSGGSGHVGGIEGGAGAGVTPKFEKASARFG